MSHIFISYSKQDKAYALKLVNRLRDEGFDVWIDNRSLRSSEDWWRSIVQAIWECDAFIVLLTPHSDASRWVQREITVADSRQKAMFPLLLAGEFETPNWSLFVRTQYIDVRDGSLPPQTFFDDLGKYVTRKPERGADVTATGSQEVVLLEDDDFRAEIANVPLSEAGFLSKRILVIGAVALAVILLLVSSAVLSQPGTDTDITPSPSASGSPTTQATDASAAPTTDPSTQAVTIPLLNEWRAANGYPALTEDSTLTVIANVHLNYLSSLPISDLPVINLYLNAEGQGAAFMAEEAGYAGSVQMFVEVRDRPFTLGDLLTKFQMEGSSDLQEQMREYGLAQVDSPDTGQYYFVLILGVRD